MQKVNKGIVVGAIVEFIAFDLEASHIEKRILSIGYHYIVEDVYLFKGVPVYTIKVKCGETIPLYGYQLSIVKPVQHSTVQLTSDLMLGIKHDYFYNIVEFDKVDGNWVGCFVKPENSFTVGMLPQEALAFNINNTGAL